MSKVEKKKAKLKERIDALEAELRTSLTKKANKASEINLPKYREQISKLTKEWQAL